ncbi:mannose-1-phosphate guanylyltransferase/mannose-6-phosphate isomerase [Sphingobium sp. WTD-1]|uniref:mannose-1-phosphate guanylyltransferase/mannose-6-phosphate isomerase n=1 Tax=Sphingobium sp. WTD-1 TaxID=2979467 RepID=UPI0024DDFC08|nr:mannose-1-phosphate guanylyltransferase/mannose-6-phosphate isomerase [Sphingobium sp. WTD-1]WIA56103.1 mannose-1-phosphate guanylyltransferase/mannose-6-phosphate isomerase [Sphingobium sp. WTD-1]
MQIHPVILIGGSGTRLWPLSRPALPKQFLPLVSDRSMLDETIGRVDGRRGFGGPILVSGQQHLAVVQGILAQSGAEPAALLIEPEGRNTAPAIAMAAHWIVQTEGDGLMLVMPSDHVITDIEAFHRHLDHARPIAEAGHLVTFGIKPDHPATGYGYIEKGEPIREEHSVFQVSKFVEKPPLAVAEQYLADGRYDWNAGIFLFTARHFLDELARHAPAVAEPIARAMAEPSQEGIIVRPEPAHFLSCANDSIDYAVLEKTDRVAVVAVDIGWSDVGTWDALWSVRARDENGNSIQGAAVTLDSSGNLLLSAGGPPIAALGVTDSIVISTAEVVLVLPRDRSQDVKAMIDAFSQLSPA